jgi:hypothetical protein
MKKIAVTDLEMDERIFRILKENAGSDGMDIYDFLDYVLEVTPCPNRMVKSSQR